MESTTVVTDRKHVRIAVVGSVDAGKSSCIGVLTSGKLDDGRGAARSSIFIHKHEMITGRTSAVSRQPVGYCRTTENTFTPVFITEAASASSMAKNRAWKELYDASDHIVDFIDLAGHERYCPTSVGALSGGFPDFGLLLVNALSGVIKITREHLGLLWAFQIPMIIVISKIDMAPVNVLDRTKGTIKKALSMAQRKPYAVRTVEDITRLLETDTEMKVWTPVIQVSFVQGTNIDLLHLLISQLKPRPLPVWLNNINTLSTAVEVSTTQTTENEFAIDDTYTVEGVGFVICGMVLKGQIEINTTMWLGPLIGSDPLGNDIFNNNNNTATTTVSQKPQSNSQHGRVGIEHKYHYIQVKVRSMRQFRSTVVEQVSAGNNCAIAIRPVNRKYMLGRGNVFRGVRLLSDAQVPEATSWFQADITILHHATQIKAGYETCIHLGSVRQSMRLIQIQDKEVLRDGDRAKCIFRFMRYAVHIHLHTNFVFREGMTKGLGTVIRQQWTAEEKVQLLEVEKNMLYLRTQLSKD